jgi:lysophospholipase L1-like esterase
MRKPTAVKLGLGALVAVLLLSVVGNFVGYHLVYKAFDKYNDSRLDPLGEGAWRLQASARGDHRIVLLGDSHARNWHYPGADVLNLGIPSQTSAQIRLRSDSYRDSLSGRRLIVFAGGNDIKSVSTNLARKDEIVRNCLSSLDAIVSNHKGHFDEIVLVTVPPAFSIPFGYRLLYCRTIADAHLEINQGIRDIAAKRGVRLIDAYQILQPKTRTETLSADGIHMNPTAYKYLEETLSRD